MGAEAVRPGDARDERFERDADDPGHCSHNGFVLFRLERTGGVDEASAGGETLQRGREDHPLTDGLAGEFLFGESQADLGVAAERAGAAAGDVAEDEVELAGAFRKFGRVDDGGIDVGGIGEAPEPRLHRGHAFGADVGGEQVCVG